VGDDGDDALMERVKTRDGAAFECLLARHVTPIHRYVMRLVQSPADADELAQETFLRVWSAAETYRPGAVRFTTWLHRIAHNLCVDRLRRSPPDQLDDPDALLCESGDPERAVAARETAARLHRALGALPVAQRAALLLTEVQGLSSRQAAEVMDLGVRAVESLLARARRTLRERLERP
jgi:RNA polymerase sigma-70 factor (ECF subfamily)